MLGRDHHDVCGTDSTFPGKTANIKDGKQCSWLLWPPNCFAGNAARGLSLVSLHHGGGVCCTVNAIKRWFWFGAGRQ
jgi:urocanate hydratase